MGQQKNNKNLVYRKIVFSEDTMPNIIQINIDYEVVFTHVVPYMHYMDLGIVFIDSVCSDIIFSV